MKFTFAFLFALAVSSIDAVRIRDCGEFTKANIYCNCIGLLEYLTFLKESTTGLIPVRCSADGCSTYFNTLHLLQYCTLHSIYHTFNCLQYCLILGSKVPSFIYTYSEHIEHGVLLFPTSFLHIIIYIFHAVLLLTMTSLRHLAKFNKPILNSL